VQAASFVRTLINQIGENEMCFFFCFSKRKVKKSNSALLALKKKRENIWNFLFISIIMNVARKKRSKFLLNNLQVSVLS
jgi:hypothetical protein